MKKPSRFIRDTLEGIVMARTAIMANPLRAALTMLGIIIGIVTVTLMSSLLTGLTDLFHETTSSMGTDVYYIDKFNWMSKNWMMMRNRPPITAQDAFFLRQKMTTAKAISVSAMEQVDLQYFSNQLETINAVGADAEYEVTNSIQVGQGRFFATEELASARPVCVIGYDIWEKLFHKSNPIGKQVRADGYSLEVIGVAKQVGGLFGDFGLDNEIIMPLQTLINAFGDPDRSVTIQVKAKNVLNKEDTKAEADYQMRIIRHLTPQQEDNFGINSQDQFDQVFDQFTNSLKMIGLTITGLSLLVGGIGIMNIMFVSVKERTKEIGIRKAIGARRRMLLTQFLSEASMLCIAAGSIGLLIAYAGSVIVNTKVLSADSSVHLHFTPSLIVLGLGLSTAIGLISGILPAWQASKLNPVDALRYE